MKISELITKLQKLKEKHDDYEVRIEDSFYGDALIKSCEFDTIIELHEEGKLNLIRCIFIS